MSDGILLDLVLLFHIISIKLPIKAIRIVIYFFDFSDIYISLVVDMHLNGGNGTLFNIQKEKLSGTWKNISRENIYTICSKKIQVVL